MTAPSSRIVVVAEAAQGFEGDVATARLLARAAARAGADQVKFQLVYADELAVSSYEYYGLFRALEMSDDSWGSVARQARDDGIAVAFDVFGPRSLDLAVSLGASAVKIHSTDFFNEALIAAALEHATQIYLSTGGITVDEIAARLSAAGSDAGKITILYGFQAEPTTLADNHLARLRSLQHRLPGVRVGFMDHAAGDADEAHWLGLLAIPLGATLIEKHITLDPTLRLEDYVSALGPTDFASYVRRVRATEAAMGAAELALTPTETLYRRRAVKVVVATRRLAPAEPVGTGDVALLRAALADDRRPLERLDAVVGRCLRGRVDAGQPVYEDLLA